MIDFPVGLQVGLDLATALSVIAAAITYVKTEARKDKEKREFDEKQRIEQSCDQALAAMRETMSQAVSNIELSSAVGRMLYKSGIEAVKRKDVDSLQCWSEDFRKEYRDFWQDFYFRDVEKLRLKIKFLIDDDEIIRVALESCDRKIDNALKYINQMLDGFDKIVAKGETDVIPASLEKTIESIVAVSFLEVKKSELPFDSINVIAFEFYEEVSRALKDRSEKQRVASMSSLQ